MAFDLLAPVRLGFRIGFGVLRFELRVVEQLIDRLAPPDSPRPAATPAPSRPAPRPATIPDAPPGAASTPPAPEAAASAPPPPVAEPAAPERRVFEAELQAEPVHIDDEPELVAEFADPGAEEGAGAEVHVAEPWDGYRAMDAAGIRDRIATAEVAELTVIQLYESAHRKRRTVLEAVERRQRELANAPAAR